MSGKSGQHRMGCLLDGNSCKASNFCANGATPYPPGTTPQARPSANHPVLSPPPESLARFEVQVTPMNEVVLGYAHKIQNLRRKRDLLLPRLLSGQVFSP